MVKTMPNKPTAIDVLCWLESPERESLRHSLGEGWSDLAFEPLTVILDALKLAAVVEHPRVEDGWVKQSGETGISFWDTPDAELCSVAEAFAELYPEDV